MRCALLRSLVLVLFALPGTIARAQQGSPQFSFVDLTYPPEALAARVYGVVVVRVTVGADGRPEQVDTLSGVDSLASAVVTNVKGWRFPVTGHETAVAFRFEIDPGACNDDRHSLFRLVRSNLAVVTACTRWGSPGAAQPVPSQTMVAWGKPSYPDVPYSANLSGVAILDPSIDSAGRVLSASILSASSPHR